jgi:hypothetical protein
MGRDEESCDIALPNSLLLISNMHCRVFCIYLPRESSSSSSIVNGGDDDNDEGDDGAAAGRWVAMLEDLSR